MEFIIFLSKIDKEILELITNTNYIVEENKKECLLNKGIAGLHNFKENKIIICTENAKRITNYEEIKYSSEKDNFKTKRAIRKALRHEATHIIQKCNNNQTTENIEILEKKLHQKKRKALKLSTTVFSGNYAKEVEAYVLEDKPKKVKKGIEKYCL